MGERFVTATLLLALVGNRVGAEAAANCTVGDVSCGVGCRTVMLCLANDQQYLLANCSVLADGTTEGACDADTLTCRPAADVAVCVSPPDEGLFRCHETGYFPNPYDCHSYFNCTEAGPLALGTLENCPIADAYDPLSQDCRLTSSDRVCTEGPVPRCAGGAQSGAQQENPNIYYVCVTDPASNSLVPWLFRCANLTDVFVNGRCQARSVVSTTSAVTVTTTSQATTTSAVMATTTSQATTTSPVPTFTTSQATTTSEVPTTTTSQATTTSAVPTTTTSQATTTSAVPTTTTSKATITSPVPTTTTAPVSTTAPYYCVQPSTTVPDPTDCQSFYLCTQDLLQIHYKCRNGYFYNKATGNCVKGSC